jgi:hypothetical protein
MSDSFKGLFKLKKRKKIGYMMLNEYVVFISTTQNQQTSESYNLSSFLDFLSRTSKSLGYSLTHSSTFLHFLLILKSILIHFYH